MQKPQSNIEGITFGVEIETTISRESAIRVGGYHAGLNVESARIGATTKDAPKFERHAWKAESDCSIYVEKPGHMACEFVSPILKGEAGVRHLIEFIEFLREIGASVNRSCGFHIHVGAESAAAGEEVTTYIDKLARLAAFNTKALYAQTGTINRERGHYCAPIGTDARKAVSRIKRSKSTRTASVGNRYQLLNLTNLPTRGTVEFRCFAGTLNTSKALLHLFSVLALCIIARTAKTPSTWDNRPLTGSKALTNFLKVRPMLRIVGTATFAGHFQRMVAKALEMGAKYDLAQAALDAVTLTTNAPRAAH
jgi:hypothetical protein